MQIDVPDKALWLIKTWEGFEATPYEDVAGVPTIGYGFTGPALKQVGLPFPEHITREDAYLYLQILVGSYFAPEIVRHTRIDLAPHQLGALCSFCYNVGMQAYKDSTLRAKLNAGEVSEAADEFGRWVYANGVVYEGLVKRRADEEAYFSMEDTNETRVLGRQERVVTRNVVPLEHPPTVVYTPHLVRWSDE